MEGRRFRRQTRTRGQTLLPLHSTNLSNSISCWYCDLKLTYFNEPIYKFGQKHSRFLKVWFSVGTGFSLSLLLGVTMMLIWESFTTSWLTHETNMLSELFDSLLFGVNPWVSRFKMSLADLGYLVIATVISVTVHEFGHAAAAARNIFIGDSEGIQLEYIAIFLAVLFPGALVAFDFELLRSKPRSTALRIYCAGIWHNAVCCAACGLALLMLPFFLCPLYTYGDGPMVTEVSPSSPLSGYLSPGDIIVSLEGTKISSAVDWMEATNSLESRAMAIPDFDDTRGYVAINRTYCAPKSLVENCENLLSTSNRSACPAEHVAFVSVPCFDIKARYDSTGYCLSSSDAVSLKSCGVLEFSENTCSCSENELCLSPVHEHGVVWAEISYRNRQCNSTTSDVSDCQKSFLYVGDAFSLAQSVRLTSYQPRFPFPFIAYIPDLLEKSFVWTFQVSVALALLNSLPVYCLDGESIFEAASASYFTVFSSRRRLLIRVYLLWGSLITCLVFLRTLFIRFW